MNTEGKIVSGMPVQTKDGRFRGTVVEIDNETVYIELTSGVEMEFPRSQIEEEKTEQERNLVFLARVLKRAGFKWNSIANLEGVSQEEIASNLKLFETGFEFKGWTPKLRKHTIKIMMDTRKSEDFSIRDVEYNSLTAIEKFNLYFFLADVAVFSKGTLYHEAIRDCSRNPNMGI